MAMWVFGYGSLIWKFDYEHEDRKIGFIKDYRRVFYQASTEHRGTKEFPGRVVRLEPANGEECWGAAYKVDKKTMDVIDERERRYGKVESDFFTDPNASTPAISNAIVYFGNENYLGEASLEEMAIQIAKASGPSGSNRDYVFKLKAELDKMGQQDKHVDEVFSALKRIISSEEY